MQYAEKSFETIKEKGYASDFQGFIEFIDDRKEALKDGVINDKLNSKQWARIYGYGKENGLTTDEINDIINDNLEDFNDGDQFVLFAQDEIDRLYGNR